MSRNLNICYLPQNGIKQEEAKLHHTQTSGCININQYLQCGPTLVLNIIDRLDSTVCVAKAYIKIRVLSYIQHQSFRRYHKTLTFDFEMASCPSHAAAASAGNRSPSLHYRPKGGKVPISNLYQPGTHAAARVPIPESGRGERFQNLENFFLTSLMRRSRSHY